MSARHAKKRSADSPDTGDTEYLSPNAAGQELGITGEAVKQWIYQRKLPATKLPNGYWRILRDDLECFVKQRREGGRRRMLIVGAIAKKIAAEIETSGWQPLIAHNPVDAVIRAFDSRPSAVLIDLASLGDGGWTVAEKIRSGRGTKRLPIFLVAPEGAEADTEAMERALAVSAQGYLCGDVTAEAVLAAAKNVLGK
ncbi:MAG: helix-turn-helix domain-containing protein [Planctomycetota bacterium]|jgi:CheY-like chemotaxis protein